MRFDPRLLQPDDAPLDMAGELDLPADLAELAAQLSDDAQFLAARYPAAQAAEMRNLVDAEPVAETKLASQRTYKWLARVSASAAAVALVCIGTLAWRSNQAEVETPAAGRSFEIEPAAPTVAAAVAPPVEKRIGPRIESLPGYEPVLPGYPASPAVLLHDVSEPELEGLLDLWQNGDEPRDTRISI